MHNTHHLIPSAMALFVCLWQGEKSPAVVEAPEAVGGEDEGAGAPVAGALGVAPPVPPTEPASQPASGPASSAAEDEAAGAAVAP